MPKALGSITNTEKERGKINEKKEVFPLTNSHFKSAKAQSKVGKNEKGIVKR
jgi:hypothetical protein